MSIQWIFQTCLFNLIMFFQATYFLISLDVYMSICCPSGYLCETFSIFTHALWWCHGNQAKKLRWTHLLFRWSPFIFNYFLLRLLGTLSSIQICNSHFACYEDICSVKKETSVQTWFFKEAGLSHLFPEVFLSTTAQLGFFFYWISLFFSLFKYLDTWPFFCFNIIADRTLTHCPSSTSIQHRPSPMKTLLRPREFTFLTESTVELELATSIFWLLLF